MQLAVAVVLLASVLAFAVVRPRGLPEAVAAVPAGMLTVAVGLVPEADAWAEVRSLLPTIAFLAAVLLLAHLADADGVFRYAGAIAARISAGRPVRLLATVFGVAAVVTAVLSLDATVVLLTPVLFATAAAVGVRPRPYVYACTHLANSASLLLPVSNLTNLLAFAASGLSFVAFARLMALPWLAVILVEYVAFRVFFASDLGTPPRRALPKPLAAPRWALTVLALTLVGFALGEQLGYAPAWAAAAGAVLLAAPRLRRAPRDVGRLLLEANPLFLAFVLGLALVVLAVLIGVNVGPNLTYVGSLATLLWRQLLHARDAAPALGEFVRLGVLTVPAGLVAGVAALWAGLTVWGPS